MIGEYGDENNLVTAIFGVDYILHFLFLNS